AFSLGHAGTRNRAHSCTLALSPAGADSVAPLLPAAGKTLECGGLTSLLPPQPRQDSACDHGRCFLTALWNCPSALPPIQSLFPSSPIPPQIPCLAATTRSRPGTNDSQLHFPPPKSAAPILDSAPPALQSERTSPSRRTLPITRGPAA